MEVKINRKSSCSTLELAKVATIDWFHCIHTISVWWVVRGLLGSAADSVPAASVTVSGSSSRTYPRSGRSTCSANKGTRESCIALERVVTFDP